jgi:hypothetical protein
MSARAGVQITTAPEYELGVPVKVGMDTPHADISPPFAQRSVEPPTLGHRYATFDPRSLAGRRLGSHGVAGWAGMGALSREARRGRSRAGQGGRAMLRFDPVGALASVRLEGFDSVPGFLHRASHEAADGVSLMPTSA